MILVDVNILIGAVFEDAPHHARIRASLEAGFQGQESMAIPWAVLSAFVRISTNPRAMRHPLSMEQAIERVDEWMGLRMFLLLEPLPEHAAIFWRLLRSTNATSKLVPDAHLAAIAVGHDCAIASVDRDFGKFPGLRWINPLAA